MKYSLVIVLAVFVSACAVSNPYIEPTDETANVSRIESLHTSPGIFTPKDYTVIEPIQINDKNLKLGHVWASGPFITNVMPGENKFLVRIAHRPGSSNPTYEGYVIIQANIQPNTHYKFKGGMIDGKLKAWLEHEQGNRVSDISETALSRQPEDVPIMVPVFIGN